MNAETVKQENQEDLEKKDNKEEAVESKTADSDVEQKSNDKQRGLCTQPPLSSLFFVPILMFDV